MIQSLALRSDTTQTQQSDTTQTFQVQKIEEKGIDGSHFGIFVNFFKDDFIYIYIMYVYIMVLMLIDLFDYKSFKRVVKKKKILLLI